MGCCRRSIVGVRHRQRVQPEVAGLDHDGVGRPRVQRDIRNAQRLPDRQAPLRIGRVVDRGQTRHGVRRAVDAHRDARRPADAVAQLDVAQAATTAVDTAEGRAAAGDRDEGAALHRVVVVDLDVLVAERRAAVERAILGLDHLTPATVKTSASVAADPSCR